MLFEDFVHVGSEHYFKLLPGPGVCSLFFHRVVGGVPQRPLVLVDLPAVPTKEGCAAVLEHLLRVPDYSRATQEEVLEIIRSHEGQGPTSSGQA